MIDSARDYASASTLEMNRFVGYSHRRITGSAAPQCVIGLPMPGRRTIARADVTFAPIRLSKSSCCTCSIAAPIGTAEGRTLSSTMMPTSRDILANPLGGYRISCRIFCYRSDVGESNGCLPAFERFPLFSKLWHLCARTLYKQLA